MRERVFKAAQAGFSAVEIQFIRPSEVKILKIALEEANIPLVLFNVETGDRAVPERGFLNNPKRNDELLHWTDLAFQIAKTLNVTRLNIHAGNTLESESEELQIEAILDSLSLILPSAKSAGVELVIEVLNPTDHRPYFFSNLKKAEAVIRQISDPNVRLLFDIYHISQIELDVLASMERTLDIVGHIQIADLPGRHQPGSGKIDFDRFFAYLYQKKFAGYIGAEYNPTGTDDESLNWLANLKEKHFTHER